jgi:AcrR family transcriptional regulator
MENPIVLPEPLVRRAVERTLEDRNNTVREEVERLMRAAVRIVSRTHVIDPKISDILAEAGLSTKAFYRHFRSKDELMITVLTAALSEDVARLHKTMAAEHSPLVKVRRWIEGMLIRVVDSALASDIRPFVINGLRLSHQFPDQWLEADDVLQAPLREAILEAVEAGELASADPASDALAIYRLTLGLVHSHVIRREAVTPEEVDHVVDFSIGALRRRELPARRRRRDSHA